VIELATAIFTLISELAPLGIKAFTAKQEDHEKIKADAAASISSFLTTIDALPSVLAADDAQADAAAHSLR
jgi:hypothetical protein